MIIKVAGTAKTDKVHLCISEKPEGKLKEGWYEFRNKSGVLKEYRQNLKSTKLDNLRLNKLKINKFEGDTGVSYPVSLYVTHRGQNSHIINIGAGGMSKSVTNSLLSLLNHKDIANHTFSVSFYDKEGVTKAAVQIDGQRAEWYIPVDDKNKMVSVTKHKGQDLIDDIEYSEKLIELSEQLNPLLPSGIHQGEDALDGFYSEQPQSEGSSLDEDFPDEVPVAEVKVSKPPVAEDLSFV